MQDTAPCAPQRSPLCLPMPAPPRRHPMLPGLLVLILSVTHVMGADEEVSRSPLVRAMAASEKEQVRMLLPEAERGTQAQGPNLCFDAVETVCFCDGANDQQRWSQRPRFVRGKFWVRTVCDTTP
jgi:hypothetical protein